MKPYDLAPLPKNDRMLIWSAALIFAVLAALPLFGNALVLDKLTLLMVYLILAVMWNLLAGFAGLVSVGHQAFIGLGGYFTFYLRLLLFLWGRLLSSSWPGQCPGLCYASKPPSLQLPCGFWLKRSDHW